MYVSNTDNWRVLSYWRDSLADSGRMDIDPKKSKQAEPVSLTQLSNGRIEDKKLIKRLFDEYAGTAKKNRNNRRAEQERRADEVTEIKVLLCPVRARLRPRYGVRRAGLASSITPLWMPAVLFETGGLAWSDDAMPWLSRNLLEPLRASAVGVTIAHTDDVDSSLSLHKSPDAGEGWSAYWQYGCEMLKEVTERAGRTLTVTNFNLAEDEYGIGNDYETEPTAFIMLDPGIRGTVRSIIELYDYVSRAKQIPPLLQRYSSLRDVTPDALLDEEAQARTSSQHLGQMTDAYALTESQRETIQHYLQLRDGEIIALNGPPGTGKTALLQSVVASMWVESAYANTDPPVIVAASANNQAVRNVIQSFGDATEKPSTLAGRWLPDVSSYGLYCPSSSVRDEDIQEFQTTDDQGNGFPSSIQSSEYIERAREYFLSKCSEYSGSLQTSVADAADFLQAELKRTVDLIKLGIEKYFASFDARRDVDATYGSAQALTELINSRSQTVENIRQKIATTKRLKGEWIDYDNARDWWMMFTFLPFVRRRIAMRNASFFTARNFEIETDLADERHIIGFLDATVSALENEHKDATAALLEAQRDAENLSRTNQEWRDWQTLTGIHNEPPSLFNMLDQNLRHRAFKLATHYWEGKWLLEMRGQLDDGYNENQSPSKQKRKWKRYAKLTPCFVSTLYMVPKFFSAFTGEVVPLIEFIDLLIIDEAGQVAPEVAGASFALAKKALIVGDTLQIEPVWSVTRKVDSGNLQKHELISTDDDIEQFNEAGMSAATGSAMRVAQRQSRFQKYTDEIARGMFLSEHQRCVPEIIDYCNALAYKDRLEPIRERGVDYPLPRMGFAHIPGQSQSQGGSRSNRLEAEVIAQWISDQRSFLIDVLRSDTQKSKKTLSATVAVVTPFASQAQLIDAELEKRGITDVTVGTIHALQGAARDVIIFSPVYDQDDKGTYFFDCGVNMLNVAVSRARDSFLVFGDMSVFDPKRNSPSGLLARYLFEDEANEITNIQIETRATQSENLPFRHLSNNKEHEEEMIQCFGRAKHSLVIVSPWITAEVIEKHGVDRLVREASNRGVIVSIYVDEESNKYNGRERPTARRGKELLRAAGAQVKVASPVHNKTLCMDDYLLIEGSFNWLSAQRDRSDKYYKENASLVYEGIEMGTEIKKIIGEMERRVIG